MSNADTSPVNHLTNLILEALSDIEAHAGLLEIGLHEGNDYQAYEALVLLDADFNRIKDTADGFVGYRTGMLLRLMDVAPTARTPVAAAA